MSDQTVESREIDIDVLVDSIEGQDRHKPEIAYEFSNGKKFKDKGVDSALYNPPAE